MIPATITIYPYEPFEIDYGLTFLNIQCKEEFSSLMFRINQLKHHETFLDDVDQIIHFFMGEDIDLKSSLKQIAMVGDLPSFEINSTSNSKLVFEKIIEDTKIINKDKIEKINQQINELVFDSVINYEVDFEYNLMSDLTKLLKSKGLQLDADNWDNYYDKLQSIIRFYSEFSQKKLVLFYNLERLCSPQQLSEVNDYLKSLELSVVSFESYPLTLKDPRADFQTYSIDEDHVRFDY